MALPGLAGQMLPQGFNGIGQALQAASPLLLAMSAGLGSGQGAMSQMPMGLMLMQQQQKQKREEEALAAGTASYGSWNTGSMASGIPAAMGASNTPAPPTGPLASAVGAGNFSSDPSLVRQDFASLEQQYRLPPGYLDRSWQIESGRGSNMDNPNSSASGHFQFIDSTAAQYGVDRGNLTDEAEGAARLASDNASILRTELGREPTAGELYLAHQQGAGGASALLSNPNAPAAAIVGEEAVRLNGGDAGMTAGQFAQRWLDKFGEAAPPIDPRSDPQVRGMLTWLATNPSHPAAEAVKMELQMRLQTLASAGEGQGITDQQAMQAGLQEAGQQPGPPKPAEPYTLNPGDVRFGGDNQPVASVPAREETASPDQRYKVVGQRLWDVLAPGGPKPVTVPGNGEPIDPRAEGDLRKEWNALTTDFRVIGDAYTRIGETAKSDSPAGDLSLIFNYMKMLDPGSVVRETEFAVAQNAAPLLERLGISWDKVSAVWAGERLTPGVRADFLRNAHSLLTGAATNYRKQRTEYVGMAESYGFDPKRAVPDLDIFERLPEAPPPPADGGAAAGGVVAQAWMFTDPSTWTPEQHEAFKAYADQQLGPESGQ